MDRLRILTWHIHGSYLYYLVQCPHDFYVPVKPDRPARYLGRTDGFPWPSNLHEVPADEVKDLELDCILFQDDPNYLLDQFEILTKKQRQLPKIYLEHDPPRPSVTDTRHLIDDPHILLVHVTHFNDLMWNSGATPTRVIDHGVLIPDGIAYTGEIERGLVIINNLYSRGRRLGLDIFEIVRKEIPLDIVGMDSKRWNGLGDLAHDELVEAASHYRFLFNPIRYTSLGLAVCEAMMVGLPIVGLATTEMVTVIENGVSGYIDTNVRRLIEIMQTLLSNPDQAHRLGQGAKRKAVERFNIQRFVSDWNEVFHMVTEKSPLEISTMSGAVHEQKGSYY